MKFIASVICINFTYFYQNLAYSYINVVTMYIQSTIRNHLKDSRFESLVNDFCDHLPAIKQKIIQVNKWKNERKEVHLEARNAL